MGDMLVKLYELRDMGPNIRIDGRDVRIVRPLAPDKYKVLDFVKTAFSPAWACECDVCFSRSPISCFIALYDGRVIGFSCYDAAAKGFFGPIGISEPFRGKGVGDVLLVKTLLDMKAQGYGYAVIGGTEEANGFYQKAAGAVTIPDSTPGIYKDMIQGGLDL